MPPKTGCERGLAPHLRAPGVSSLERDSREGAVKGRPVPCAGPEAAEPRIEPRAGGRCYLGGVVG